MDKLYNRTLIGFGIVFAALQFYDAGLDAHKGFYNATVFDLVTAIFWVFLIGLFLKLEQDRREHKIHMEHIEQWGKMLEGMAEAEKAANHQEYLEDMLQAVIKDVTKGKKITKAQLPKVEKAFHENTGDHFLRLNLHGSGQLEVEISEKPFPEAPKPNRAAPGRSAAHAAAAKRGDAARAKINKPTKSQERRIAATEKASK